MLVLAKSHLVDIKIQTLSTDLQLPRDDYLTNTGNLQCSEHKAIMQVCLIIISSSILKNACLDLLGIIFEDPSHCVMSQDTPLFLVTAFELAGFTMDYRDHSTPPGHSNCDQ